MESEYLRQSVGPVLTDALAKLLQHRIHHPTHPQNALDFVASYLMQHHAATQSLKDAKVEHVRIAAIQAEVLAEKIEVERELNAMREKERLEVEAAAEQEKEANEIEDARAAAELETKVEEDRLEVERAEEAERDSQRETEIEATPEIATPTEDQVAAE